MSKKIIIETSENVMYHHTGITKFRGCQCHKDCTCNEDYIEKPYNYYSVKRKNKKTTTHDTLEDAFIRWDFVCSLSKRTQEE